MCSVVLRIVKQSSAPADDEWKFFEGHEKVVVIKKGFGTKRHWICGSGTHRIIDVFDHKLLLRRRKMMMAVRIIELNSKILSRSVRAESAERAFLSMPPDLSILYTKHRGVNVESRTTAPRGWNSATSKAARSVNATRLITSNDISKSFRFPNQRRSVDMEGCKRRLFYDWVSAFEQVSISAGSRLLCFRMLLLTQKFLHQPSLSLKNFPCARSLSDRPTVLVRHDCQPLAFAPSSRPNDSVERATNLRVPMAKGQRLSSRCVLGNCGFICVIICKWWTAYEKKPFRTVIRLGSIASSARAH